MTDTQKKNVEKLRLRGLGYKRIADVLDLSVSTVKSHCQRNKLPVGRISSAAEIVENKAVCKQCGKPLEQPSKRKPKTFCGDKCRYAWWNANQDQRHSAQYIVCAGCGNAFASVSRNRKYCGHACYINDRFPKEGLASEQGTV